MKKEKEKVKKKVGRPLGVKDKKKRSYTPRRRRNTMIDGEMKKSSVGPSTAKIANWNGGTVKAERQSKQHLATTNDVLLGYDGVTTTQANINYSANWNHHNETNAEFGHSSKYIDIGSIDQNGKWNAKRSYHENDSDIFAGKTSRKFIKSIEIIPL